MVVRTSKKRHGGGSRAAREYHGRVQVQHCSAFNSFIKSYSHFRSLISAICLAYVVLKQPKQGNLTVLGFAFRSTAVLSRKGSSRRTLLINNSLDIEEDQGKAQSTRKRLTTAQKDAIDIPDILNK